MRLNSVCLLSSLEGERDSELEDEEGELSCI